MCFSIYESESYKLNHCDLSPNVDWSETHKVCLKYNQIYISLLHSTSTVTIPWVVLLLFIIQYAVWRQVQSLFQNDSST